MESFADVLTEGGDSFEKVVSERPDWADPYIPRILDELTTARQPSWTSTSDAT